jgi:putative nucleotidyltransferase with HDIG domain
VAYGPTIKSWQGKQKVPSEIQVDVSKVKKAAHNGTPLTITTYTLPHDIEVYMEEVLKVFLHELGQDRLKDYLSYCLRELAVNAKKANTKRVYFDEKGLSLDNPNDYVAGMTDFKKDTLDNLNHYLQLQKDKGYYIKIMYQAKGGSIMLEVRNNAEITKEEYVRIHDKLARSRAYASLEDALSQVLDDSEGAGLGLVILVMMLKKIGITEDCFDIYGESSETIARITVPLDTTNIENLALLSDELVRHINILPQFPENVSYIQSLIGDPEAKMVDIARQISTDPSLTADLLKLVNSAQFMLSKRVDNITEAVKMVGLRGIRNLLYSYGTQKVLGSEDDADKKHLWDKSYRVAFYAYNLAKNFKPKANILDDAYVGGILHDMGQIVFSSVHPELLDNINHFCSEKGLPAQSLESLSAGLNHAEIGARIAEKWNFPEGLVAAIRYHHDVTLVPAELRDVAYTVYLANAICDLQLNVIAFEGIDEAVLANFGIVSKNQVEKILEQFSEAFDRERAQASDSLKRAQAKR